MKRSIQSIILIGTLIFAWAANVHAVPYSPNFSDYGVVGPGNTQVNVDAAANSFFYTNYGITMDHMYLYYDNRDTFDGIGLSNGFKEENNAPGTTGTINFSETTDYVTIDYLAILPTIFNAWDSNFNLVDSFTQSSYGTGTVTLSGIENISYLTITADGGYGAISALNYNYDGTTDGHNDDLSPVPEPSTMILLGGGLFGVVFWRRKLRN
jgi:hypothetical protein